LRDKYKSKYPESQTFSFKGLSQNIITTPLIHLLWRVSTSFFLLAKPQLGKPKLYIPKLGLGNEEMSFSQKHNDHPINPPPLQGGLAPPRSIGKQGEVLQLHLTSPLNYKEVKTN